MSGSEHLAPDEPLFAEKTTLIFVKSRDRIFFQPREWDRLIM